MRGYGFYEELPCDGTSDGGRPELIPEELGAVGAAARPPMNRWLCAVEE